MGQYGFPINGAIASEATNTSAKVTTIYLNLSKHDVFLNCTLIPN